MRPTNLSTSTISRSAATASSWLHRQCADADGLLWMSRQRDRDHALLLFGDRLDGVLSGSRIGAPLARNPALRDAVLSAALRAGIDAD